MHSVSTLEAAQQLLQNGADPNAQCTTDGYTPLMKLIHRLMFKQEATINNDLCNLLIQHGAKLDIQDNEGKTVLHHAIEWGRTEASIIEWYQYFLSKGASSSIQDNEGETVLHLAVGLCRDTTLNLILLLLKAGIDPKLKNKQQQVALEKITTNQLNYTWSNESIKSFADIALQLLQAYPTGKLPTNADTLLWLASHSNSLLLAEELVKRGLVIPSEIDQTLIFEPAINRNHIEILQWLIKAGANINYCRSCNGNTAILHAVERLRIDGVKLLLASSADLSITNNRGDTALHILLNAINHLGFDPHLTPEQQYKNAIEIFLPLLEKADLIDRVNSQGQTPLACCVGYGINSNNWPFLKKLIFSDAHLSELDKSDPQQIYIWRCILDAAVHFADEELIQHLLDNYDKQQLFTKLVRVVIDASSSKSFELLLANGLDINQPIVCGYGQQLPIEYAFSSFGQQADSSKEKNTDIRQELVMLMIEKGATLHFPSAHIANCLHTAILYGWSDVIKLLLQPPYRFSINRLGKVNRFDSFNFPNKLVSPLECAVYLGQTAIVELLLKNGADIKKCDKNGKTLLHVACEKGFLKIAELLLAAGADVNAKFQYNFIFNAMAVTPFISIFSNNSNNNNNNENTYTDDLVTLLLQQPKIQLDAKIFILVLRKKDITLKNIKRILDFLSEEQLLTIKALHIATEANRLDVIDLLLQHPAAKQLLAMHNHRGETLLHLATVPGREKLFQRFIELGVDSAVVDFSGYSATVHAICHDTLNDCGIASPENFGEKEFKKLRAQLIEEPEFQSHSTEEQGYQIALCSYKLIYLFGTAECAQAYIKKYRNSVNSKQPIHDLCLFNLPRSGDWDQQAWAKLVMEEGTKLTSYLNMAPRIETILGKPPQTFTQIEAAAKEFKYNRELENPQLASLFANYQVPESAFERVLNFYKPKSTDYMPDLFIDGQAPEINKPRYYLKKLAATDLRGFILGALTHCCQSVGSAGEACAMHGMTSSYGGFYALFKRDLTEITKYENLLTNAMKFNTFETFIKNLSDKSQRKKYSERVKTISPANIMGTLRNELESNLAAAKEGELIAQSWAWISAANNLVFDSWERLRENDDCLCEPFLRRAAEQAITKFGFQKVLLGKGGQTPQNLTFETLKDLEQPKDYYDYRDSNHGQLLIADQQQLQSKTSKEEDKTISEKIIAFSPVFSKSPEQAVDNYTLENIDYLLNHYIRNENIQLCPAICSVEKEFKQTLELISKKLTQAMTTHCFFIIPMQKTDGGWTSFILEIKYLSPKMKLSSATYLDPAAESIPYPIKNLLEGATFMDVTESRYNVRMVGTVYEDKPSQSGIWIIHQLKHFAETKKITLIPDMALHKIQVEQLGLLQNKNFMELNLSTSSH